MKNGTHTLERGEKENEKQNLIIIIKNNNNNKTQI